MPTYDLGDGVNLRHLVYDRDGALTDATVSLLITKPDLTTTGPTVTRVSLGQYDAATYVPNAIGEYRYRWSVSGAVTDVSDGSFYVANPAPAAYTNLPLVKAQLGKITSDDRDEIIQTCIVASARMIDSGTGRWPGAYRADAVASTRTFYLTDRVQRLPGGTYVAILIDDIASASGITLSGGYQATGFYSAFTQFITQPNNAIAKGEPISSIIVPATFAYGIDSIQMSARWGWPATPADIELANRLLAARLYRRKDSPQGVIASPDFGGLRVSRFDPDVRALLAPYMIPGFA